MIFFVFLISLILANECDASGNCASSILLFPNGGNNTGTEPSLSVPVSSPISAENVARWAKELGFPGKPCEIRDERGDILRELTGNVAYVVPKDERWIWPGVYVGHKVTLRTLGGHGEALVLETLSLSPRLFAIDGFLSAEEATRIIRLGEPLVNRARVAEGASQVESKVRTSGVAWLPADTDVVTKTVGDRVANVVNIHDQSLFEFMQIVHYKDDQRYESHYDYFPPELYPGASGRHLRLGQQRLATLFFYLNDVDKGGETVFPLADVPGSQRGAQQVDFRDCTTGLRVKPVQGRAILWYNVVPEGHMDGKRDVHSMHGACPVHGGEKWGANFWIKNKIVSNSQLKVEEYLESLEDMVADDMPQSDDFELGDVTVGFRFRNEQDNHGRLRTAVLRTRRQALDMSLPRIMLNVWPNGGADTQDATYAYMSVNVSPSPYSLVDVKDVAPCALLLAFPDPVDEPCPEGVTPFAVYDRLGRPLASTQGLASGDAVFLVDAEELWVWPPTNVGYTVQPPQLPSATLETVSVMPRVFSLSGAFDDALIQSLIQAATPLLAPASTPGAGGALGTDHAALPVGGLMVASKVRSIVAQALSIDKSKVSGSVRAWRLPAGSEPVSIPALAPGGELGGERLATVLVFGTTDDAKRVFPFAGHPEPTIKDAMPRDACNNAAYTAVSHVRGNAMVLYHTVAPNEVDERAAHMVCSSATEDVWVFEQIVFLRPPTIVPHGDFTPPSRAYTLEQTEPEAIVGGVGDAVVHVNVFRVGGNNTGVPPFRATVTKTTDTTALGALITRAAQALGFVGESEEVDVRGFRAFNDQGFAIKHTSKLGDGSDVYVAPRSWHWVWPSMRPGHVQQLKRVPRPQEMEGMPLMLETMSIWPRAFLVRHFLSPHEVSALVKRGEQTVDSPMSPAAAPLMPTDPSTTWLFVTEEGDMIDVLNKRVAALMRVAHSEEYYEALVLERYKAGQKRIGMESFFDVETHDFSHMPMLQHGVNRLAGIYIMLQKAETGGDIVFPHALQDGVDYNDPPVLDECNPKETRGVRPHLNVGDAMLYYTLDADSHQAAFPKVDRRSIHTHCPTGGDTAKWGGFMFLHNRKDPTRNDLVPKKTQKDINLKADKKE